MEGFENECEELRAQMLGMRKEHEEEVKEKVQ